MSTTDLLAAGGIGWLVGHSPDAAVWAVVLMVIAGAVLDHGLCELWLFRCRRQARADIRRREGFAALREAHGAAKLT